MSEWHGAIGRTITSPYIRKQQLKHFLLLDILPHIFSLFAVISLWVLPFGWPEISVLIIMWLVTGLGITVGYHRLFTHKSFQAQKNFEIGLAIAGGMAGQGGVISWACLHRRHHQLSDREGDPHSPNLHGGSIKNKFNGLLHSHFLWMRKHEYPNPGYYVRDLLQSKHIVRVNRYYYIWVLLGIVIPALVVGLIRQNVMGLVTGALWGGSVRLIILGHTIWGINSFLHVVGKKTHQTSDNSRNAPLFGLFTFGESFHNAHHAHPRSALFGLGAPSLDPGYWLIWASAKLGLARNVHVPDDDSITKRLSIKVPSPK